MVELEGIHIGLGEVPGSVAAQQIVVVIDYESGIHAGFVNRTFGCVIVLGLQTIVASVDCHVDGDTVVNFLYFGAFAEERQVGGVPRGGVDGVDVVLADGGVEDDVALEIFRIGNLQLVTDSGALGKFFGLNQLHYGNYRAFGAVILEIEDGRGSQHAGSLGNNVTGSDDRLLGICLGDCGIDLLLAGSSGEHPESAQQEYAKFFHCFLKNRF